MTNINNNKFLIHNTDMAELGTAYMLRGGLYPRKNGFIVENRDFQLTRDKPKNVYHFFLIGSF